MEEINKQELLKFPYEELFARALLHVSVHLDVEGNGLLMNKIIKFLNNDFRGMLNKKKLFIKECGIKPQEMRLLMLLELLEIFDRKKIRQIINDKMDSVNLQTYNNEHLVGKNKSI